MWSHDGHVIVGWYRVAIVHAGQLADSMSASKRGTSGSNDPSFAFAIPPIHVSEPYFNDEPSAKRFKVCRFTIMLVWGLNFEL